MKSPASRKLKRMAYYARHLARDLAPQSIFRRRLAAVLDRVRDHDAGYLARRLNFYNKLSARADVGPDSSTIGAISMAASMYYYDLKEHARYFPRHLRLAYRFGDVRRVPDWPSIVKSRPIAGDNRNSILMKLNKFRHFHFPADRNRFLDKKPIAVWRGGAFNARRVALLARHHDHPLCDVGDTARSSLPEYQKPFLRPDEQMRFRYIISIEGNDVASNLKWILASNSLCLMPAPVFETWFMECRLEPGKHYVRLRDDFEDLEEKIIYYERHVDEALAIVRNANAHAAQFFDARREQLISILVLYKYFVATGQLDPDPRLAGVIAECPVE